MQGPIHPMIITYGNILFDHASKFNLLTPNKSILHMLSNRYYIICVDEYLMSQVCSVCHSITPSKVL